MACAFRSTVVGLSAACVVLVSLMVVGAISSRDAAADSSSHLISWLAAGDSYASGAGLVNTTSTCARGTGVNGKSATWAIVTARQLTQEGRNFSQGSPDLVACTGAITDEFFTGHSGGLLGAPHPQQWNAAMGRFNFVTFSFGGDDLGFASIIQHCLSTGCPPDAAVRLKIHQLATTGVFKGSLLIPSYPTFLNHVATSAVTTGGNVVVMGYPEVVEDPALWPAALRVIGLCQGLSPSEADLIRGWAGDLNATIGNIVARVNAEPYAQRNGVHFTFVDPVTARASTGISSSDANLFEPATGTRHELCSAGNNSWMNGVSPAHPTTRSYHPDQAGETAMGKLAAEVMDGLLNWNRPRTIYSWTGHNAMSVISCPTTSFCAAGNFAGGPLVMHGSTWSQPVALAKGYLVDALSCSSANFCMAILGTFEVPSDQAVFAYSTYDGKSWSGPESISASYPIGGVSCVSSTYCVAVDGGGNLLSYDGSTWRSLSPGPGPGPGFGSVSCATTSFCALVDNQGILFTYNGEAWLGSPNIPVSSGTLSEIQCPSVGSCVGLESNGNILTLKNSTWTETRTIQPPYTRLLGLSCSSTTFCGATRLIMAGGGPEDVVTWDGRKWSDSVTVTPDHNLGSLSCPARRFCIAVDGGKVVTGS